MKNDHLNKLVFLIFESLQRYSIENFFDIFYEVCDEILEGNINLGEYRSYVEYILLFSKGYQPESAKEISEAVSNLIEKHDSKISNDLNKVKKELLSLAKYDKLVDVDGKAIPLLLNHLFGLFDVYDELFKTWHIYNREKDTLKRTIALSSSNTPKKMLNPIKPYLDNNQFIDPKKREVYEKLSDAYINNSYELDHILSAVRLIGKNKIRNADTAKLDALFEFGEFANSSRPVDEKHIIEGLKIEIANLYLKDSIYQKLLKIKKSISRSTLASHIDTILWYVFKIDSKTDERIFTKSLQVRTNFESIPLYEFTKAGKEKINPAFQDEEFFTELIEKLKGRIESNTSKKNRSEKI